MASVLAQFIANRSGQNVLDDGDTAKLLNNLELAIKTYANNNLPAASITTVGITKLSSETNSSSEVLAATPKAVKSLSDATLKTANNLSEIKLAGPAAVASAVDNLGLTEAAAATADALKKSANLSDLTNKSAARTALELGNSATKNVGAVAGTVMAGDDARVIGALQASANLSDLTNKSASRVNLNVHSRDEVVPAVGGEFRGRVTFPIIAVGGVQGVGIQISTNTEVKVSGDIAGPTWTNNQDSLLSTWIRKQITEGNMNKVTAIRRGVVHEVGNSVQAGSFAVTAFVTQGTIFVAELQYQVNGQWIVMGQA
ncbi:phage tail protein [Yersinia ruckeri]|uniref:tail fiber protein n=1 Tax=Yersinia ruckeri TaxID=29486 RepID=UPI001F439251|nr:phage tail protein [Yersinia ruckeri]UIN06465.1 phage tail protein [Yersinia ruckeri]